MLATASILTAVISFGWKGLCTITGIGSVTSEGSAGRSFALEYGTGANKINTGFQKTYTISASGTQVIDLTGSGSPAGIDGASTSTLARIKIMLIENLSTAQGGTAGSSVAVGGAESNAFVGGLLVDDTSVLNVPNGGAIGFVDPSATGAVVTAGTGDQLLITNLDAVNAATVRITVGGCES